MKSDIVAKLRNRAHILGLDGFYTEAWMNEEAAETIEFLRQENQRLEELVEKVSNVRMMKHERKSAERD